MQSSHVTHAVKSCRTSLHGNKHIQQLGVKTNRTSFLWGNHSTQLRTQRHITGDHETLYLKPGANTGNTGNIGHKTNIEDIQTNNTSQKAKKMSNMDPTDNLW